MLYLQLTDEETEALSFSNLAKMSYPVIITTIIKANVFHRFPYTLIAFHTLTNVTTSKGSYLYGPHFTDGGTEAPNA